MEARTFFRPQGEKKSENGNNQGICLPADSLERNERNKPHGHNENAKKDGRENVFSRRLFSFSPDAQHPVGGGTPPSPWRCRTHSAIFLLSLDKHVSDCFCFSGTLLVSAFHYFRKMGAGTMSLLGCGVKPHKSFPNFRRHKFRCRGIQYRVAYLKKEKDCSSKSALSAKWLRVQLSSGTSSTSATRYRA